MIELLITMLLLAVVMTGLTAMQVFTIRQVTSGRTASEATRLGQMQLEGYKLMRYADLPAPLSPAQWITELKRDGSGPMQGVGVDGESVGPFTVDLLVEDLGGSRRLLSMRVTWIDLLPGATSSGISQYQTQQVLLSLQRSQ